eukprot:3621508-Pleurochrysis_carterae.AAC.3
MQRCGASFGPKVHETVVAAREAAACRILRSVSSSMLCIVVTNDLAPPCAAFAVCQACPVLVQPIVGELWW